MIYVHKIANICIIMCCANMRIYAYINIYAIMDKIAFRLIYADTLLYANVTNFIIIFYGIYKKSMYQIYKQILIILIYET